MAAIHQKNLNLVKKLYYEDKKSMNDIAIHFSVSIDCVAYFMRHHDLKRRTSREASATAFENKIASFSPRSIDKSSLSELRAILAMLYWGEGYKGTYLYAEKTMDFANSDPTMIQVFINILRSLYQVDEKKFRVLLYCYSNQNVPDLIKFWSRLTKIPKVQFTKPYVRTDSQKNVRAMKYGLIHVRYHDKKLLKEFLNLIESIKSKYAPVV